MSCFLRLKFTTTLDLLGSAIKPSCGAVSVEAIMVLCAGIILVLCQAVVTLSDEANWQSSVTAPVDAQASCRQDVIGTYDRDRCEARQLFGRPLRFSRHLMLIQRNRTTLQRVPGTMHRSREHRAHKGSVPVGLLGVEQNVSLDSLRNSSLMDLVGLGDLLRNEIFDLDVKKPETGHAEMKMEPVSVTMRCVMFLTVLLLACYTILSCLRNSVELSEVPKPPDIAQGLEVAVRCASHGAALGTLFVGMRMYVLASTGGTGEPQEWVKGCMFAATAGLTLQIMIALALPTLMNPDEEGGPTVAQRAGQETDAHPRLASEDFKSFDQFYVSVGLQALAIIGIYGGAAGVIAGAFLYEPPAGIKKLPVSPAVTCVMLLDVLFLLNQLHLFLMRELGMEMGGVIVASLRARKAPMLAVLFLAARMRNLQVSPETHGQPPIWARTSFFVIVVALILEMTASAIGGSPLSHEGKLTKVEDPYHPQRYHPCVRLMQQIFSFILFVALGIVIYSIYIAGDNFPLSVTMKCTLMMSALFFIVHVFQWFASFSTRVDKWGDILQATALSAGVAVSLCPMLSSLFIGCRMRALQLTDQKGSPQWWAQDAMSLDVIAIFIQVFCCIALPAFTGAATSVDGDGNAQYDLKPMIGAYMVQIVKYCALLFLYSGVVIICYAITVMYKGMKDESSVDPSEQYKKIFMDIGIVVFIVILAGILSSAKVFGLVIKWAIESADDTFLGVQITVGKAALSICRGYVFLSNLVVQNPEGVEWASPALLKLGKIVLKINLWRIITSGAKEIEIQDLVLTGIEVNYEKDMFKKSNVQMIIDFLAPPDDKAKEKPPEKKPEEPKEEKKEAPKKEEPKKEAAPKPVDDGSPPPEIILGLLQIKDISASAWNTHAGRVASVVLGNIDIPNFQEHFGGKTTVLVGDIIGMVLKTICNTVLANAANLVMGAANIGKFMGREAGCGKCLPCIPSKKEKKPAEGAGEALLDEAA